MLGSKVLQLKLHKNCIKNTVEILKFVVFSDLTILLTNFTNKCIFKIQNMTYLKRQSQNFLKIILTFIT